jgi:CheY-like chemotaxis protein
MSADRADLPSRLQRILIADDFPQAAENLAKWLRQLGFTVQTAQDGAQALDAAERFLPQLIILDIEMPKLTGYEVAERVRQKPWGKNIVLVAFTALGTNEDRRRSLNAGFDDHLVKPVAFSNIVSLVSDRWQQMSARKTPEIGATPDQAAIRRAFELARRAFERIREVEQRLRTSPKEMMLAADNREEYQWWVSINRQIQIERDSAYREFGEAQKSFAYLLSLHMKTLQGPARLRQQATGPPKFKYTQ